MKGTAVRYFLHLLPSQLAVLTSKLALFNCMIQSVRSDSGPRIEIEIQAQIFITSSLILRALR